MTDTIYLATHKGVVICQRVSGSWQVVERGLTDHHVACLIAREGVILAGTREGIYRSDDGGKNWRAVNDGLSIPRIRWLAYHPDISDLEFAGTEPAGIFVSRDGGQRWNNRPEVEALRDEHEWMLPYSPEAGCVRGFSFNGSRTYAAVEVGGVLRSDDGGETWGLVQGSSGDPDLGFPPAPYIYPDLHDLAVHPSDPNLVYAATGGGLYRTVDGGATWDYLYDCYCRALWIDPDDPQHIIFGPADQVGAVGRIEESRDGGQTWHLASGGLQVPWPNAMPERMRQVGAELLVVLSDGRLLAAPLATLDWKYILGEVAGVDAVTVMG
jgi:photosystem II stability/assembly factor-like uncharacterized protein